MHEATSKKGDAPDASGKRPSGPSWRRCTCHECFTRRGRHLFTKEMIKLIELDSKGNRRVIMNLVGNCMDLAVSVKRSIRDRQSNYTNASFIS